MKEATFSHRFSIVIKVIMEFLSLILFMCCITSIDLQMLSCLFISMLSHEQPPNSHIPRSKVVAVPPAAINYP